MNRYKKEANELNDKLYSVYLFCRKDMKNTAMNIACSSILPEEMYKGIKSMWNSDIAKIRMLIETEEFKDRFDKEGDK